MKHIVLAFCTDLDKDPVSAHVLARLLGSGIDWQAEGTLDGHPVLRAQSGGVRYDLLQLDQVLSHDYRRYAPRVNEAFGDADAIVIVNWHEGKNAPDRIFTVQTTGDMESGTFSRSIPPSRAACFWRSNMSVGKRAWIRIRRGWKPRTGPARSTAPNPAASSPR